MSDKPRDTFWRDLALGCVVGTVALVVVSAIYITLWILLFS